MIRQFPRALGLLLLASQFTAQGTTWYVDNVATGANSGASWTDAWSSFAAIQWNWLRPGDNLYISGGPTGSSKTYGELLQVGASGTASAPIRIGLDTGNPSHNGTVILDGSYISVIGQNYVTLSGNVNGQRGMMLSGFFSTSVGTWGNKVVADSTTGFTLEYCSFNNVNQMVSLVGATGFKVQYCAGTDIRGDAAIRAVNSYGGWDANMVQNNDIELARNAAMGGPDGVQGSDGMTIRNNHFHMKAVSYTTSYQHPDYCQITGNKLQIYGNDFENIGDSGVDMDWWANPTPHDIWIFNNTFRINQTFGPYPPFIRWYDSTGAISSLTNLKIINNTFVDDSNWAAVQGRWGTGTPTITGVEIKNNIFVNSGAYDIVDNPGLTATSISFANNLYWGSTMVYKGASYFSASAWASVEPSLVSALPAFVYYSAGSPANDLHLTSGDTAAAGQGLNLTAYFTTDKDGVTRPSSGGWAIGAYEPSGSSSSSTSNSSGSTSGTSGGNISSGSPAPPPPLPNPVVSVGSAQTITLPTTTVTLTGSASDPAGQSVTVAWSEVSGPATVTFSSPTSTTTQATFPATGSYTVRLTANAGGRVASADTSVTVLPQPAPPPPPSTISFQAPNGQISAPFVVTSGYVYQPIDTVVAGSGRAAYGFSVPVSGNYVISASVNASSEYNNSFYLNIDAEPTDPTNIWDIHPFTNGFETRQVSWRGNGTYLSDQYTPKVFSLAAGQHTLIIRGRENSTLISSIQISPTNQALPPTNLNVAFRDTN
jgi:hypothetical protein